MISDEQISAAREQIYADILSGVKYTIIDGEEVGLQDAMDRLKAIEHLENKQINAVPRAHMGMRTTRLISPGAWS